MTADPHVGFMEVEAKTSRLIVGMGRRFPWKELCLASLWGS